MISRKNFVDVDPTQIPVDTEYFQCNFMRTQPDESGAQPVGHRLFPGDDTPRIFRECNLVNCEPPPNSTLIGCNTRVLRRHRVTETDTVTVDGFQIASNDRISSFVDGRWNPDTNSYDYLGTPEEIVGG
jgi:hypothetical protein